jgi:hypothetical protein
LAFTDSASAGEGTAIQGQRARLFLLVMPRLDPGIHDFWGIKTWMAGTGPAMTAEVRD